MATENKIKYFENREDWRKWLMDNFETEDEIWFVFPLKSSGEKSIAYNDAVEEALCFEWIDSTINRLIKNIEFSVSRLENLKVHTRKPTKKDLNGYWQIK